MQTAEKIQIGNYQDIIHPGIGGQKSRGCQLPAGPVKFRGGRNAANAYRLKITSAIDNMRKI
jgi:hypothetical protein